MRNLLFILSILITGASFGQIDKTFRNLRATSFVSRNMSIGDSTFYMVSTLSDFPTPINGVIYLDSIATYYITSFIDLEGNRIQGNHDNAIIGSTPELCGLLSTGLDSDSALIKSVHTLALNNIRIDHPTGIELDATGVPNQVIDWYGVNFLNCTSRIGSIKNYENAIMNVIGFLNSGDLTFDGTFSTIAFDNTIFENAPTKTSIILPSTLTINRRFRVTFCAFISQSGETAIYASDTASIPDEGYILFYCNFSGGGTYVDGVDFMDNKTRWNENRNITNTVRFAGLYMISNATPTTIDSIGVYRKVSGTTSAFDENQRFSHSNNRLTYVGAITVGFKLTGVLTFTTTANNVIEVVVFVNGIEQSNFEVFATASSGGRAENVPFQWFGELDPNDYVEVYVANETAINDITITDINYIIQEVK